MSLYHQFVQTSVGCLKLIANQETLLAALWECDARQGSELYSSQRTRINTVLNQAELELNEYFSGRLTTFTVPITPKGTWFQERVWQQLLKIPYVRDKKA